MSDKDQFTFEDDDGFQAPTPDVQNDLTGPELEDEQGFPEDDLSDVFSDAEHEVVPQVTGQPEPEAKAAGNPRTRNLLVLLLLVVAGAAGAYYFMDLGDTTPDVPSVPATAQNSEKSVKVPPQPAKTAAVQGKTESATMPVTVAVPPPPPAEPAVQPVQTGQQQAAVEKPQSPPALPAADKATAAQAKEAVVIEPKAPAAQPETTEVKSVLLPAPEPKEAAPPAELAKPAEKSINQVADGAYALDAGSFLFETNRDAVIDKVRKQGYEPLVTPVKVTLDMTRLRVGTYDKDQVQAALDFARSIEPGSYSAPAGDRYVIYAGTFLRPRNVEKLSQRFLDDGIKVYAEPVQVVRTLSRIRFGSFATKADAAAAAKELDADGLKSTVVESK